MRERHRGVKNINMKNYQYCCVSHSRKSLILDIFSHLFMIIPRRIFFFIKFDVKTNVRHTLTTCLINYELKIFFFFISRKFIYLYHLEDDYCVVTMIKNKRDTHKVLNLRGKICFSLIL